MALPVNTAFVDQVTVITQPWIQGSNDWTNGAYGVLGATYTATAFRTALGGAASGANSDITSLSGMFLAGSYTVSLVLSVVDSRLVANTLGTDNIDFGFSISGDATNYLNRTLYQGWMLGTDSRIVSSITPGLTPSANATPVLADVPASGNVRIKIGGESPATQNYTVNWWMRRRV